MPNPEATAIYVMATAGNWCSATLLRSLEEELLQHGQSPTSPLKAWKKWLEKWAEEGWLEQASDHHGRLYHRLNHNLRHEVLKTAKKSQLKQFSDAIETRYWVDHNWLRVARLSLYLGDHQLFDDATGHTVDEEFWIQLFGPSPSSEMCDLLAEDVREKYFGILANHALELRDPPAEALLHSSQKSVAPFRIALHALIGDVPAAETELSSLRPAEDSTGNLYAAMAVLDLVKNDGESAKKHASLALSTSQGKRKYPSLGGPLSAWAALCVLAGSPEQRALGELMLSNPKRRSCGHFDGPLLLFVSWLHGGSDGPLSRRDHGYLSTRDDTLSQIFRLILIRWKVLEDTGADHQPIGSVAKTFGFYWLHAEIDALDSNDNRQQGILAGLFAPKQAWERQLDTLSAYASSATKAKPQPAKTEAQHRVVWLISCDFDSYVISALLQKCSKKGFSKGREISANDLWKKRKMPWVNEHDRAVIEAIEALPPYRGTKLVYRFGLDSLAAMVGHPRIFWKDGRDPIEVAQEPPSLRVIRQGESIVVAPLPFATEAGKAVLHEGNRLLIVDVDEQFVKLCEAVGTPALGLPAEAESQLSKIIGAFPANILLHTDITPEGKTMREQSADARLVLQLRRSSDVLRVSCTVMPLGQNGPALKPGQGNELLVAEVDGKSTKTRRNLEEEKEYEQGLRKGCPSLLLADLSRGDYVVTGLGPTLTLLRELHNMGDAIVCLWREGEPMRVDMSANLAGLQLKFGDTNAWLSADIRVSLSDTLTLKAQEIVSKMVAGASNFVELGDNQFVALSEELRSKLEALADLGKMSKSGLSSGPANAYALSAWLGDIDSKCAKKGTKLAAKRLAKVRESTNLTANVPKTFKAELRPYQLDAFHWLSRLAHWGGGALLCDDMGLGKTVQMLAVLTRRGAAGPALVVAPVSVGPHWGKLMRQFAPTLNYRRLDAAGRKKAINDLGPRDVLVVSYGLLHNECELLSQRSFETIVLDEAQAIKNPRSHRAKAAFKLQGKFRVVTTGTPIENNLGDLWSLMNFTNPGLLGSSRHFADTFGKPIQKEGDPEASLRLRKLLAPFLLRRTKTQVLTELPGKTEITLEVEPLPDEAAFYASMRDSMLAEFQKDKERPAQQRMQVLAALMKLRRIACHPTLGDASSACGSAKQEAFLQLVEELREAGHRILVFSQFVGHLAIARANLEARNISYQYLDGSTSKAKRERAVDAFQDGEGDVFLISLKAGGTGLHLTGADYVIHLDPWWNPAVEDQASDRAHRMGQTRPVTVYRLITRGTVEQKVLDLHARKRQLAEDLISGSEGAGSLGVNELMELMADAGR